MTRRCSTSSSGWPRRPRPGTSSRRSTARRSGEKSRQRAASRACAASPTSRSITSTSSTRPASTTKRSSRWSPETPPRSGARAALRGRPIVSAAPCDYRQRESGWRGEAKDPARVDLLFKIAWIEEEKLNDLEAARKTLARICELEPGAATELRALRALERIESAGGPPRLPALSQVLERQLSLAEHGDAHIELASRLANLYAEKLARPAEALAHLERALKRDPDRRATHAALEKLVEDGRLEPAPQLSALRMLVSAYEERLRTANGEEAPGPPAA